MLLPYIQRWRMTQRQEGVVEANAGEDYGGGKTRWRKFDFEKGNGYNLYELIE
ncbi:hypothetical protein M8C21_011155, partial [Ambrosia artemisiifolia]